MPFYAFSVYWVNETWANMLTGCVYIYIYCWLSSSHWCSGSLIWPWFSQFAPSHYQEEHWKSVYVFHTPQIFTRTPSLILSTHVASFSPPLDSDEMFFSPFWKMAQSRAGLTTRTLLLYFRAALQPWAVCLPQWEDAMYPYVLAVWRLDSMWGQEWRDGLSPWV